jgi:putative NADH-flavin reductase
MKVTLFGATGKTGHCLIKEGIRRGVDLTVFARSGSPFRDPNVRVVRGDLTDPKLLREAVLGADAVLSALGPTSLRHPNDLPITRATEAIIGAMKEQAVARLVAISTGTAPDPADIPDPKVTIPAVLIKIFMPIPYRDIIGLAAAIRRSELDWTMVRVAILKNGPALGRLNVGLYGHTKHSMTVRRADVAEFMFDQIESREFIRSAPGISTR